jgi:hypothetical protein
MGGSAGRQYSKNHRQATSVTEEGELHAPATDSLVGNAQHLRALNSPRLSQLALVQPTTKEIITDLWLFTLSKPYERKLLTPTDVTNGLVGRRGVDILY